MSYLRNLNDHVTGTGTRADKLVGILKTAMREKGDTFAPSAVSQHMYASMESMQRDSAQSLMTAATSAKDELKSYLADAGYSVESLTDAQLEVGVLTMLASSSLESYRAAQFNMTPHVPPGATLMSFATSSAFDYRNEVASMEAFDERPLRESLPFSITWNIEAAVQNPAAELLYPTTVVGPDQAGITIKLTKPLVQNQAFHSLSGAVFDPEPQSLIAAEIDSSILANVATKATPNYVLGENDQYFAAPTVATWSENQNGATFTSCAYKPGVKFSIVGLCINPGTMADGQPAYSDSLDQQVSLDTLFVSVKGTSATTASIIPIKVDQFTTSQFQPAVEDLSRDVVLNFFTSSPVWGATTKDQAQALATGLVYLQQGAQTATGTIIKLDISANARISLELGNVRVPLTGTVGLASVWTTDPVSKQITQVTSGSILTNAQAEYPDSAFSIVGYTIKAYRSNINRRTEGLITTNRIYTEVYAIPLSAPITAQTPLTDTRTTIDVNSPIQAVRTRNSNNAITKLLDYEAVLSGLPTAADWGYMDSPNIEGIGRHVIKPTYVYVPLDMEQVVASLTSIDRLEAVKSTLINQLRASMSQVLRDSGYQVALNQLYPGEKPRVVIITDAKTASYLIVTGDDRTMGGGFDFEVQACPDKRVFNQIYATISRIPKAGPNALTFGTMALMPELTTSLQVNRGGAMVKELMVQARTRHINTCPLLVHIAVANMESAVGGTLPVRTTVLP